MPAPTEKSCELCGATASLSHCSRCKSVSYCCKEHQRADWAPRHKGECAALAVWERSIPSIQSALPPLTPIFPFLNGPVYFDCVFWTGGLAPSDALASRFRAALQRAWAEAGAGAAPSAAQQGVELAVLSEPALLRDVAGQVAIPPSPLMWCTAMRRVATPLPPSAALALLALSRRLSALHPSSPGSGAPQDCAVPEVPPAMGAAAQELLLALLNRPAKASCYVLCVGQAQAQDAVLIAAQGQLDEGKLRTAQCTLMKQPPAECMAVSRLLCFSCGASPFAVGVQLSACSGCRRVAYCSQACAAGDWYEHFRECSLQRERVVHQGSGQSAVRPSAFTHPMRFAVERDPAVKPLSYSSPVSLQQPPQGVWAPPGLARAALRPSHAQEGLVITPFWVE